MDLTPHISIGKGKGAVISSKEGTKLFSLTKRHGCQAYTVDRVPQKHIIKIVSDLDLSTVYEGWGTGIIK